MKTTLAILAVAAAFGFAADGAKATTLTFDIPFFAETNAYSEGAFYFTNDSSFSNGFVSWGAGNGFSADPSSSSATLLPNYNNETVTMTVFHGLPFSFQSIDLADTYNSGLVDDVHFLFKFGDGSTLTSIATLDATPGLQTVVFGLSNVVSAEWIVTSANYGAQFDNIVVAATPLPAALPFFASALGGLGFVGWRRRQENNRRGVGPISMS